jgi:hypothetical protein
MGFWFFFWYGMVGWKDDFGIVVFGKGNYSVNGCK